MSHPFKSNTSINSVSWVIENLAIRMKHLNKMSLTTKMLVHFINKDNAYISKILSHIVNIYRRCNRMKLLQHFLLWKVKSFKIKEMFCNKNKFKGKENVYYYNNTTSSNVHERLFNNYKDKERMMLQLEQKYNSFEADKHPFVPFINHTKPSYSPAITRFTQYEHKRNSYQLNQPKTPQHKKTNSEIPFNKHIRYPSSNLVMNYDLSSQYLNGNVKTEGKVSHIRNNSYNYNCLPNSKSYTNHQYTRQYNNDMYNSISNSHDSIDNYCSFSNNINHTNKKPKCNFLNNYNNKSSPNIYVNNNMNHSNNNLTKPVSTINLNKMNLTLSRSTISILSTRNKTNRGINNSNIHSIMPNTPMSTRLHRFNNFSNPNTINKNYHTIQYNHNNSNIQNNNGGGIKNYKNNKINNFINKGKPNSSSNDLQMYFKSTTTYQSSKRGSFPSLLKTNNKNSLNHTNESIMNKTILHCTESCSNTIPIGAGVLNHDEPAMLMDNNSNSKNNNKLSSIKRNNSLLTSHLNNSSIDGKTTHYNSQNKSKTDSQIMFYSNISNNNTNLDRSKSSKNINKGTTNNSNNTNEIKNSFRTNPQSPNHNYYVSNHNSACKNSVSRLISPKDFHKAFPSNSSNKGVSSNSKNAFLVPSKGEQTSLLSNYNSNTKTPNKLFMQKQVVDENIYPQLNFNRNQRKNNLYKGSDDKFEITLQSINDSKLYEIANHYITTDESLDKYQCLSYACNNNYYNTSKKK